MLAVIPATLGYMVYVQFSPYMGKIWYREDSEGNGYFSFGGLFDLIAYPLQNWRMWKPELWDINYFMWILTAIACQYLYQEYIQISEYVPIYFDKSLNEDNIRKIE